MFTIEEIIKASAARQVQAARARRVSGISIDSRSIRKGSAFIAIKGLRFDGHDFVKAAVAGGAACIIVQKGSRFDRKAAASVGVLEVADTTRALGDLARSYRGRFSLPVIAVTGSNGKTTTKEMLATLLGRRYTVLKTAGTQNNQIGLPLTLLKLRPRHQVVVLELGTNHFGEIAYLAGICRPTISVITSIGPSHLEFFKTVRGVRREKLSLLKFLRAPGIAVVNQDDALLRGCRAPVVVTYGLHTRADFSARVSNCQAAGLQFAIHGQPYRLPVIGEHNLSNLLAAVAVGRLLGLSHEELAARARRIRLPHGRLQIKRIRQVDFIDDTYNANPNSFSQALRCLRQLAVAGRKIVVMGDMLELGRDSQRFHRQAGEEAAAVCDCFVGVGSRALAAAESARLSGLPAERVFTCADSRQAGELLRRRLHLAKGDLVLAKGSRSMHLEKLFDFLKRK